MSDVTIDTLRLGAGGSSQISKTFGKFCLDKAGYRHLSDQVLKPTPRLRESRNCNLLGPPVERLE